MFKRILIANRGEIALRIIRCCREMGIESVVVYSSADKESLPVITATHSVCIGPAKASDSYLKDDIIIEVAKKMLYIEGNNDDYEVSGYVSLPEVNRSSRNHMITIVNGRVVKNMEINRIINESYHSFKPDTRYPITILNINADPSLVDVNIHPTKMDIKFSKLEELMVLIQELIENKMRKINLIPEVETPKINIEKIEPKKTYQYQTLNLSRVEEKEEEYQKEIIEETPILINDFEEEIQEERKEYEEKYGPLTANANTGSEWNWIDSPWPWECEG